MKRNSVRKKSICILLAAVLLLLSGCAGQKSEAEQNAKADTAETIYQTLADSVRKTETVYVLTDAHGNPTSVTVSDWLHTDTPETYIQDKSDLTDIENVKGDFQPVFKNGYVFWNMPTTDLYYKGTSDKPLPVSFSVQYFLNDEEIAPEALAGKSGKVKLQIKVTNNYCETKNIGGEEVTLYNPVAAVGGMILPESQFSGIEVENGMTVGDGAKEFVLFAGLPGMNESLGIDKLDLGEGESITFADTFTVTATVSDFSLGNLYFAVLPVSVLGNIEMPKSVDELKTTLNQLKDLEHAMQTLDPKNVLGQLMQEPEKISELTGMVTDAMQVYRSNEKLIAVLSKYMTEENVKALQNISGAQTGNASLGEMVRLLSDPEVQQFLRLMPAASGDLVKLMPMLQGLSEDLRDPEIQKELENLPKTAEQIADLQNGLEENRALITALATLADAEKMQKLTDILHASNGADFTAKLTEYGVLAENADGLLTRMAETLSFGNRFTIYSDAAEGAQTSVMFVYKTPPIRKTAEVAEQPAEVKESWFRRVFGKH